MCLSFNLQSYSLLGFSLVVDPLLTSSHICIWARVAYLRSSASITQCGKEID